MFNLNSLIMKFKLLKKLITLAKSSLYGVMVLCLSFNVILAAEVTNSENDDFLQGITVTGKVSESDNNEGLPGANVIVKGTSTGTVTDLDGNYSIQVPDGNASLVYSSVGYETAEVAVGNRVTIDITLNVDVTSLEEIVVVGYGEQKKTTVTGSVASVDGDNVRQLPTNNLSNSLTGQIPGLVVVNRSGEPGADGSTIRIRG
jgi:hypothetical protein